MLGKITMEGFIKNACPSRSYRWSSLTSLTTLCILLVVSMSAYATTMEFYRWQFGEFAAQLRYLKHGKITPGINEIYAREMSEFLSADDLTIGFLCPEETSGTLSGQWTFFGARYLPLLGKNRLPSFYAVTYLGGAVGFHNGSSFDALLAPKDIRASLGKKKCVQKHGLSEKHVGSFGYAHLTRSGHYAPLSFNSLDIDGDGAGDFTFGGILHVSSSRYTPVGHARAGAEAVFIKTDTGVRLVRLLQNVLSVERYRESTLSDEVTLSLEGVAANAGHSLVVLPGDGRTPDSIAVRSSCGLAVYAYRGGKLSQTKCITGLIGERAMPGGGGLILMVMGSKIFGFLRPCREGLVPLNPATYDSFLGRCGGRSLDQSM